MGYACAIDMGEEIKRFRYKFRDVAAPDRKIIQTIVNKIRSTWSLLRSKETESKHRVLTEDKVDENGLKFGFFAKRTSVPECELSRNACLTTGTISGICCEVGVLYL
jgi:hypothetical protein